MKSVVLFLTACLIFLHSCTAVTVSYVGEWGVFQTCNSGCCCPNAASTVRIASGDSGKMTLEVVKGSWNKVCEDDYDFDKKTKVILPWNDGSTLDEVTGFKQEMTLKDGTKIDWYWFPYINVAKVDNEVVEAGQLTASLGCKQGTNTGCGFVVSAGLLQASFVLLAILSIVFMW